MFRPLITFALNVYWKTFQLAGSTLKTSQILDDAVHYSALSESVERQRGELRRVLRNFPYWYNGHIYLGELSLELGKVDEAFLAATAALKLKPESMRAQSLRGKIFLRTGKSSEAAHTFELLVKQSPSAQIKEYLAAAYLAQDRRDAAREVLEAISEKHRTPETAVLLKSLLVKR